MNSDRKCDLLVVGLGPAGASAAAEAAKSGLNVIAIERNAEPGLPVQCAEFVPMMLDNGGISADQFAVQNIEFMWTEISEGSVETLTPNFSGHMIDRARFDQNLIEKAQRLGVDCHFSAPLRKLEPRGVAHLADGRIIRPKVIVGADGPRSICGQAIGAPVTEMVETRQITVDLLAPHQGTDIFLDDTYLGGYAWLFPRGKRCNVGLGVSQELKPRLKPLLDKLHQRLIDEGRVGSRIHRHTGGLIPVSGPVRPVGQLGEVTVLLTGDAAGLTNPVTGAGINAAVQSGQLAGEAAAGYLNGDKEILSDFSNELEALFGRSLRHAVSRRKALLNRFADLGSLSSSDYKRGWVAFNEFWNSEMPARSSSNSAEKTMRMSA